MLAKRAADTRAWTRVSHAASAEQWLANVSGTSEHTAREQLLTAYRFDALMMLAAGGAPAERAKRPEPVVRLNVGLQSLLEGRTVAGEVCEIPGVGPVPVAHAREVLQH
ncbi:MAG: hypothetical protein WEA75_03510, partial [Acidimicrobiia bacterium]